MNFAIQAMFNGEWSDDPSLLGDVDNTFLTEKEAEDAIDALVAVGFDRDRLRIRPSADN